jgi:hypothetical protein
VAEYRDIDVANLYWSINLFVRLNNELPDDLVFEQENGNNERNHDDAHTQCEVEKYFPVVQSSQSRAKISDVSNVPDYQNEKISRICADVEKILKGRNHASHEIASTWWSILSATLAINQVASLGLLP